MNESLRLVLRQHLLETHSPEKCMQSGCNSPPEHEAIWADGRARAWFCDKHYASWSKTKNVDIVKHHKLTNGRVGKKYGE